MSTVYLLWKLKAGDAYKGYSPICKLHEVYATKELAEQVEQTLIAQGWRTQVESWAIKVRVEDA